MIDRRQLLAAALPAVALPPLLGASAAPGATGLHGLAQAKGFRFGSAVNWHPPGIDAASVHHRPYTRLLERDCGLLVAENEMKWQALRPAPDAFDFRRADSIMAYAASRGFAVRGHTLLWHYHRWFPRWLNDMDFGDRPATRAAALLEAHLRTVAGRYGTAIISHDVVNEAVDPADASLRQTSLSRAMGSAEAVLDHAFRVARNAAPEAELVYNDYMSWEDGNEQHRAGVLRLLEGFRARGVPVDALGVQSHIGIFEPVSSIAGLVRRLEPGWRTFLDAVTAMGYRLVISEFDVRDRGLAADSAERDRGVADFARAYLDIMFAYPQLRDVLVWGMSDRYSWLRGFEPRPDGAITRGSPYDEELAQKPLYRAMAEAFAAAPARGG